MYHTLIPNNFGKIQRFFNTSSRRKIEAKLQHADVDLFVGPVSSIRQKKDRNNTFNNLWNIKFCALCVWWK